MIACEHRCAFCGRPAGLQIQRVARWWRWLFHGPYPRRWVCGAYPCQAEAITGK